MKFFVYGSEGLLLATGELAGDVRENSELVLAVSASPVTPALFVSGRLAPAHSYDSDPEMAESLAESMAEPRPR